ncbi:MAG: cytochrome c4 [Steroidobacteraceae bacterium]
MSTVKGAAWVLAAAMSLSVSAPVALAGGSAEAGAAKAAVCTACHGLNGNSTNPEWPSLAGQNAAYISEQLKLFQDGRRNNPVMQPLIAALTPEDIADLGAYFAAQTPQGQEADAANWAAGQALYTGGDRARSIPACKACHGPVGRGNPGAGYPAVRAQHSVYTTAQLNNYASGARYLGADGKASQSKNGAMMTTIAKRLTADDVKNLSSYIQGLR